MKKSFFILSIIITLVVGIMFSSCSDNKDYSNYKNELGYEAYISDRGTGSVTSFCGTVSSLSNSDYAVSYYKNNCRECDGSVSMLVTNLAADSNLTEKETEELLSLIEKMEKG